MVMKVLAEGKRLRLAVASQEGIIARWCGEEVGVQSYGRPVCVQRPGRRTETSYKAGHPGVSQLLKLSKYAKKKISIHMSCGWVVVEGVFHRLGHR